MKNLIFISYRREGGDVTAKLISEALKNRGYETFFDYDGLKGGPFDRQIRQKITECTDMILVLPKNGLDRCVNEGDWVREEIQIALRNGKNIVPVMLNGFDFPRELPEEINAVRYYNGVRFHMDYFDAVIDAIINKMTALPTARPPKAAEAPVRPAQDTQPTEKCKLTVKRKSQYIGMALKIQVSLSSGEEFSLGLNESKTLYLKPGSYTLKISATLNGSREISFDLRDNTTVQVGFSILNLLFAEII